MSLFSTIKNRPVTVICGLALLIAGGLVAWSFYRFGPQFAFVLVPTSAVAALAYRIHLRRLAQKTAEISEASRIHLATVEALATAIDARDQVGAGHVRRTQIYAVGIGRSLGMSESEIAALRTGALLHDIGKLAIPDHILNKPDSLTPAELEKTKIHPQVGAAILDKVGFAYPVVPAVKYHHECWDGSGYPEGLKGEEIPLTARVLSVADGFDTLRGARPYRPAHSREKARQIIQMAAGTRFDPRIVSILLRDQHIYDAEIDAAGLSYTDEVSGPGIEQSSFVEQIKLANREVISLYELAREFGSNLDLEETLELFASKVSEFVPFDTCAVYLLEEGLQTATAAHVHGKNSELIASQRIKLGQGATGYVLKVREKIQNVDPDMDFAYSDAGITGEYKTMASVPLIADEELVGAVTLYSSHLVVYAEEHIRLLETVSKIAAEALSKSRKHNEVATHAMTDPMTGLPNARNLQIQYDKEVARADRGGTSFQLLMLDLDGFKGVNDTFGHKAGDEMLREISKVIRGQLRDYDFLARYGGDEFVALIPETAPVDVADLCNRIEEAVCGFKLVVGQGRTASVGVSLGAARYPDAADTFDRMIVAADKVMYERKMRRKKFTLTHNVGAKPAPSEIIRDADPLAVDQPMIVELDERHVVSNAIN